MGAGSPVEGAAAQIGADVVETNAARLLSLYAMGQELAPLGFNPYDVWRSHTAYLDQQFDYTFGAGSFDRIPMRNAGFSQLVDRSVVYVSIHHDNRFRTAVGAVASALRSAGSSSPIRVVAGSAAVDRAFATYQDNCEADRFGDDHDVDYLNTGAATFGRDLIATLRRRGSVFVMLDALEGESHTVSTRFLHNRIGVRSGIFRVARSTRAIIQPFVYDPEAGVVAFGPPVDSLEASVQDALAACFHFFAMFVVRRPERWLHWPYLTHMTMQQQANPDLAGSCGDAPRYVVSRENGVNLVVDTDCLRLYRADDEAVRDLTRDHGL